MGRRGQDRARSRKPRFAGTAFLARKAQFSGNSPVALHSKEPAIYWGAMIKTFGPPWVRRAFLALISFLIVMLGVGTLFHGKIEYYNWWGGIVFAPFAIVIGSLGLLIAAFRPNVFLETAKKKSRFRGWPKGRSRY
ncbi:MAG: hypothetical protein QOJ42_2176 [Acidobacteriaceae bacterium]|nr:hypothetical protein [Acidobacteriaceae bacterium]